MATDIQDYFDRFNFDVQITVIPLSREYLANTQHPSIRKFFVTLYPSLSRIHK